jgi:hypothetical protein
MNGGCHAVFSVLIRGGLLRERHPRKRPAPTMVGECQGALAEAEDDGRLGGSYDG